MAITAADIHNQSFSIDRKGYQVDEVDVFLERVAEEIDGMNALIADLQAQLEEQRFSGFDAPADIQNDATVAVAPVAAPAPSDSELQSRVAELEAQLAEKTANDSAISQALIVAQRSADDIVANAKSEAARIVADADEEADRVLAKAEADRQRVIDVIRKLEDDREGVCSDYRGLLTDFIEDAQRKLSDIDSSYRPAPVQSASYVVASAAAPAEVNPAVANYSVPMPTETGSFAPASPAAIGSEKDLSGFGDADNDFEFDDPD